MEVRPQVSGPAAAVGPGATAPVPAVLVRGLRKSFGAREAVRGIDLAVPRGSFCGLVGRNGAGKTTSLRMICGLLRPDAGHIWVAGVPVWSDPAPVKAIIGVLPEDGRVLDRLSGRELLRYTGMLRGMAVDRVEGRAAELLDVLDLGPAADGLVIDYSHGMRKKIGLAVALLHAPEVLFLDEPFEAVDPVSARTLRAVLEHFVASGRTILFSSHVMATVEALCDRVAIIHDGRVVADGTLAEVTAGRSLEDAFVDAVGVRDVDRTALSWLDAAEPTAAGDPEPEAAPWSGPSSG